VDNPGTLIFDEKSHTYWVGKVKHDSVTKIIQELGLSRDYSGISSFYAERGRAVHKAVELIDKGTLDESSVSDLVRPYVAAYRKFLEESGYRPHAWEVGLHHPVLRFAGTIDKVGYLPKIGLGIMDIKTASSVDPSVDEQLCAYDMLWTEHHPDMPAQWRYALQLTGDGKYSLITKYSDSPKEDWLSIMTVFRKKQKRQG
jgi:hypothetical protein